MGKVISIDLVPDDSPIYDQPLIIGGMVTAQNGKLKVPPFRMASVHDPIYKRGLTVSSPETSRALVEVSEVLESEMEKMAAQIHRQLMAAEKSSKK